LAAPKKAEGLAVPEMGMLLERRLFKALLAEDGQGDGHSPAALREARWAFLAGAVELGWSLDQAAAVLGINPAQAALLLKGR
jgi:hypothetical protein